MTEIDTRQREQDERGSMLIVALGILALLSIMAVTFVKLMNLERKATTNYVDMVKARLIAEGGLERSLAQLKRSISAEQYSDPNARWIYCGGDYSLPLEEASSNPNANRAIRASFWGNLGMSYANGEDSYKVKVVDVQTQFNLNQRFDITDVPNEGELDLTYIRWLDSLGIAISKLNPRAGGGTSSGGRNPIKNARYPKGSPNAARGGKAIYLFRESRESGRLTSKQELMEVLENEDDYLLLKDYVTAHSWFDEKAVSPRATDSKNKPWSDVISREPRSPININLATTEVIAANLAGIAGRAFYVWTGEITTQGVDENHPDHNFTAQKEETAYENAGAIVYIDPFGHVPGQREGDDASIFGAIDFARLIKNRINTDGPFQSYADWEVFVDSTLTDNYLSSKTDPDRSGLKVFPQPSQATVTDLNGNPPRAPLPSVNAIRGERHFSSWFFNAVRDMVKSNFNPNARLSSWNADQTLRKIVDKGGLLWRDPDLVNPDDPNKILHQRQTLEWCFAPRGIFEVTALGEVLGDIPADRTRAIDRDKDGNPDREIFAQAKVRAILQLYNVESVRTQRDFERKGDLYKDNTDDRTDILSYPVAKIYWDPSVPGAVSDQAGYYDTFQSSTAGVLFPGRYAGYLQLATRRKDDDLLIHTQVIHMGQQAPDSPPKFEALFQDRRIESPGSNRVDIADVLQADVSNGNPNNPRAGRPVTGRVPNRWGWPYGDARRGIFPAARSSDVQEAWRFNVLTPDGYLNSLLRPSLLWYRASDNGNDLGGGTEAYDSSPSGTEPSEVRRGTSNVTIFPTGGSGGPTESGNVAATPTGAVEFWYKPDYDWMHRKTTMRGNRPQSDPVNANSYNQVYCGLLGTSHVTINDQAFTHAGATQPGVYSRGTQMFVTRNTEGALRITRLYFEVVGDSASAFEVPYVADPVNGQKMKLHDYYTKCSQDPQYTWPPKELYEQLPPEFADIRWARSDYWIQPTVFQHWRAGEWHHIAFRWNDHQSYVAGTATSGSSLQIWIDGQSVDATHHQIGERYAPVGSYDPQTGQPVPPPNAPAELPAFVRLNGRSYNPAATNNERPKDQIVIGAVSRDQLSTSRVVKDGVFKHTDDGKVFLPANGTVDDVRFYDGSTAISSPTVDYDGRFVDEGNWTGEIDLGPYFPESGVLTLGSLGFTAYLPRAYGVSGAGSQRAGHIDYAPGAGEVSVSFEVRDAAGTIKFQSANWNAKFTSNQPRPTSSSGFALRDDQNRLIAVDRTDRLIYKVDMKSAKYDAQVGLNNNDAGFNVASPILDQIELVYFLPAAKVLLKERVNN